MFDTAQMGSKFGIKERNVFVIPFGLVLVGCTGDVGVNNTGFTRASECRTLVAVLPPRMADYSGVLGVVDRG